MSNIPKSVPIEVLTLTILAAGEPASGKTQALTNIVRAIEGLVGPGLETRYVMDGKAQNDIARAIRRPPMEFDRSNVRVVMEIRHQDALDMHIERMMGIANG